MNNGKMNVYKAFISYSHAADGNFAPKLHKALHRFAKPWYKIRALRIFRDQTNLSINPELWDSILKALSESEFFILLASSEASSSEWVEKEVNFWLQNKSAKTLFIVLTNDDIVWDSITKDFDWNLTTALPKKLTKTFDEEPYYLDLRQFKKENQLSLRDPQFLDAVATIAATLHGVSKDEIVGEDVQQHRITKLLAWSAITTLVILLVAALFGFYTAGQQRDSALVEKFHIQAISAIEKPGDMNGEPIHAHLLSAQAYKLQPHNPSAYKSLLSTSLSSHTNQDLYGHKKDIIKVIYNQSGNHLASAGDEGLILWEILQNKAKEKWRDLGGAISAVAFSRDNQQIVAGNYNGNLIFWDIDGNNKFELISNNDTENNGTTINRITSVSFSADGKHFLTAHEGGMLKLWDTTKRKLIKIWRGHRGGINEAIFHPTNDKLVISYPLNTNNSDFHMKLWNLDTFKAEKEWEISIPSEEEFNEEPTTISPDGTHILSKYLRSLLLWNMDSHQTLSEKVTLKKGELLLERAGNDLIAFNSDGKQFVTNDVGIASSTLNIWNFDNDETSNKENIVKLKVKWNDIRGLRSLAFSPNKKQIAGGGKDGRLIIWNIFAGESLTQPWTELAETEADGIADFAFSNNEKHFASILDSQGVKVFDYDSNNSKFVLNREVRSNDIAVFSVALSQDGELLILGGNDDKGPAIEIWSLASDKQNNAFIKKLSGSGQSTFKHVAFGKDKKQIYAVTEAGVIVSWKGVAYDKKEIEEKTEITLKENEDPIAKATLSPDKKILMTSSNSYSGLKLWETDSGECYKGSTDNCRIQPGHEVSTIGGIAFSPNGNLAFSVSETSMWILWEVATGNVIARKQYDDPDNERRFERAYFRSDGKILFYSWDKKWMLWDVDPASLVVHACEVAGRTFSRKEWDKFIGNKLLDYEERACK